MSNCTTHPNEDLYPNLHRQHENKQFSPSKTSPKLSGQENEFSKYVEEMQHKATVATETHRRKLSEGSDKNWDLYPSVRSEVINHGSDEQLRELQELEHKS
jgi:hypothetical protein